MRLLLIDNYDSFTYNLFQLLAGATGEAPVVARNDAIPLAGLERGEFDGIVISPGPGRPDREADFRVCEEVIRGSDVPVFGVCLGHQGIGTAFGGDVRSVKPIHGGSSWISHDCSAMFTGLPPRFPALRYHSLAVAEPLPGCLRVTGRSEDGLVMALAHVERPIWGVQFHPESAGTPLGGLMIGNFVDLVARHRGRPLRPGPARGGEAVPASPGHPTHRIVVRSLGCLPDPAATFNRMFADDRFAFWIDREAGGAAPDAGCSLMGSAEASGSEVLTYEVGSGAVSAYSPARDQVHAIEGTILDVLRGRLSERRMSGEHPLEFAGGYFGYLGYELKSDLGSEGRHISEVPDAALIYATRLVVLDHRAGEAHAICLLGPEDDLAGAEADAEAMCRELASVAVEGKPVGEPPPPEGSPVRLALDRDRYLEAIAAAQRQLLAGESYEICLTNRIDVEVGEQADPLDLYLRLRSKSPAPHAAYLRLGQTALLSASPERFLRISRDRLVETSPIKGTRPRGEDPESDRALREELVGSPKEQAENMMIVDVLRNDLGRVCEVGSVEVERLAEVQSFAQVHQLVSTIRGRLGTFHDAIDCVEACFPGGSMTGAPKLRSMEILDLLEPCARGPYSGALGHFGLAGEIDLSIVIRSIILTEGRASIGTGGAITAPSDPEAEYAEILLKARPLLEVLGSIVEVKTP